MSNGLPPIIYCHIYAKLREKVTKDHPYLSVGEVINTIVMIARIPKIMKHQILRELEKEMLLIKIVNHQKVYIINDCWTQRVQKKVSKYEEYEFW